MIDLVAAAAIVAALAFGAYAAGLWITLRFGPRVAGALAALVAALSAAFTLTVRGRLCMVELLPFSSAVVLADWLPLGAGFLAGVVAGDAKLNAWRKILVGAPITLLAWTGVLGCFFAGVAIEEHPWSHFGFPIQSSNVSCSPTAAAELLRTAGVSATEREMIEACLTQSSGTTTLGLYRGLAKKVEGTGLRVKAVYGEAADLEKLRRPVLAFVYTSEPSERFSPLLSALPTPGDHSIIVFGFTANGNVDVGDPALGRLIWPRDRFEECFSGEALELVPATEIWPPAS
ncbi:MAG TPA: cysteine peptidase family C39 domain-containing protein [Pirellulales bacterium]